MSAEPDTSDRVETPDRVDTLEQALLDQAIEMAPDIGWNARLVARAGAAIGLSRGDLELLVPNAARDLAALLSRRHDAMAMEALKATPADSLKIRQRIKAGVSARMEAGAAHIEATRRCAGFLSLPGQHALGLRLAWESADLIWRWAGDRATDENHYSKRAILSGILIPALTLRWFDGREAAEAFVDARIENVMAFEKWKAGRDFDAPVRRLTDALAALRFRSGNAQPEA